MLGHVLLKVAIEDVNLVGPTDCNKSGTGSAASFCRVELTENHGNYAETLRLLECPTSHILGLVLVHMTVKIPGEGFIC